MNSASQGVLQGQESVRGQAVLHAMGIGGIPIINLENACASSATALNGAMAMINAGEIECALVLGMEKMYFEDRAIVQRAFTGSMDVEVLEETVKRMKASEEKARAEAEARAISPCWLKEPITRRVLAPKILTLQKFTMPLPWERSAPVKV